MEPTLLPQTGDKLTKNEIKRRLEKMHVLFNPELARKDYFIEKYNEAIKDPEKRQWIEEDILKDNKLTQAIILKRERERTPIQRVTKLNLLNNTNNNNKKISAFSVVKVQVNSNKDNSNHLNPQQFHFTTFSSGERNKIKEVNVDNTNVSNQHQYGSLITFQNSGVNNTNISNYKEELNKSKASMPIQINLNPKGRKTISNVNEIEDHLLSKEDRRDLIENSVIEEKKYKRHSVDNKINRPKIQDRIFSFDNGINKNNNVYMNYHRNQQIKKINTMNLYKSILNNDNHPKEEKKEPDIINPSFKRDQRYNIGNNSTLIHQNSSNNTNNEEIKTNKQTKNTNNLKGLTKENYDRLYNYGDDNLNDNQKEIMKSDKDDSIALSPIKPLDQYQYYPPRNSNPPNRKNTHNNPSSSQFNPHDPPNQIYASKESSIYLNPSSSCPDLPYTLLFAGLSIGAVCLGYYYCLRNNISLIQYFRNQIGKLPELPGSIQKFSFHDFIKKVLSPFKSLYEIIINPKKLFINLIWRGLKYITKQLFWDYITFTIPIIAVKAFLFFLYHRYLENRRANEIFNYIKSDLKMKYEGQNLNESDFSNDFEEGITEKEIISKYSQLYNYNERQFNQSIMPKLRTLRRNDRNIKLYESVINGKRQIVWQWVNY